MCAFRLPASHWRWQEETSVAVLSQVRPVKYAEMQVPYKLSFLALRALWIVPLLPLIPL